MLRRSLESKGHEVTGVVDALSELCERDPSVRSAFLCHSGVIHIAKKPGQGQLCGYRNIQMLLSYIGATRTPSHDEFSPTIPSVPQLQLLIEDAWDKGINADGRIETGGIKGTRKHIGTPEAQALFKSLDIPCKVNVHRNVSENNTALVSLLSAAEQYFQSSTGDPTNASDYSKVTYTDLPPIFLQRQGHSVTIVGFEKHTDGSSNLLVFDPVFDISFFLKHYLKSDRGNRKFKSVRPSVMLGPFRRRSKAMRRFKNFETLTLTANAC